MVVKKTASKKFLKQPKDVDIIKLNDDKKPQFLKFESLLNLLIHPDRQVVLNIVQWPILLLRFHYNMVKRNLSLHHIGMYLAETKLYFILNVTVLIAAIVATYE